MASFSEMYPKLYPLPSLLMPAPPKETGETWKSRLPSFRCFILVFDSRAFEGFCQIPQASSSCPRPCLCPDRFFPIKGLDQHGHHGHDLKRRLVARRDWPSGEVFKRPRRSMMAALSVVEGERDARGVRGTGKGKGKGKELNRSRSRYNPIYGCKEDR